MKLKNILLTTFLLMGISNTYGSNLEYKVVTEISDMADANPKENNKGELSSKINDKNLNVTIQLPEGSSIANSIKPYEKHFITLSKKISECYLVLPKNTQLTNFCVTYGGNHTIDGSKPWSVTWVPTIEKVIGKGKIKFLKIKWNTASSSTPSGKKSKEMEFTCTCKINSK